MPSAAWTRAAACPVNRVGARYVGLARKTRPSRVGRPRRSPSWPVRLSGPAGRRRWGWTVRDRFAVRAALPHGPWRATGRGAIRPARRFQPVKPRARTRKGASCARTPTGRRAGGIPLSDEPLARRPARIRGLRTRWRPVRCSGRAAACSGRVKCSGRARARLGRVQCSGRAAARARGVFGCAGGVRGGWGATLHLYKTPTARESPAGLGRLHNDFASTSPRQHPDNAHGRPS